MESYKELKVWQEAVELTEEIYKITRSFPLKERFSLTSQIQRAAVSVPANIAEGWGRGKTGEYVQFLRVARGSLMELETHLIISHKLNYINQNMLNQLEERIEKIGKMTNALIKGLINPQFLIPNSQFLIPKNPVKLNSMTKQIPRALTIAGSDSGGGAGIQADLKTFTAFGVFGMSVLSSITAQNTQSVLGIYDLPTDFVKLQIDAVITDLGVDAAKTGMLSNEDIISVVAKSIRQYGIEKLVIDPVMRAKSGDALLKHESERALIEELLPLAFIVTPNIPEAEALSGMKVSSVEDMKEAAKRIKSLGPRYVLVKGGHLQWSSESIDILHDGKDFYDFSSPRIETKNTHGTGCTYSAAICAGLAKGLSATEAIKQAKNYVTEAIIRSFNLGKGHGPLNHFWRFE